MAAILKTFAGLNFYTRTCFIDYYHISFKKSHQTLRPRSCRVNQKFGPWISDYEHLRARHINSLHYKIFDWDVKPKKKHKKNKQNKVCYQNYMSAKFNHKRVEKCYKSVKISSRNPV